MSDSTVVRHADDLVESARCHLQAAEEASIGSLLGLRDAAIDLEASRLSGEWILDPIWDDWDLLRSRGENPPVPRVWYRYLKLRKLESRLIDLYDTKMYRLFSLLPSAIDTIALANASRVDKLPMPISIRQLQPFQTFFASEMSPRYSDKQKAALDNSNVGGNVLGFGLTDSDQPKFLQAWEWVFKQVQLNKSSNNEVESSIVYMPGRDGCAALLKKARFLEELTPVRPPKAQPKPQPSPQPQPREVIDVDVVDITPARKTPAPRDPEKAAKEFAATMQEEREMREVRRVEREREAFEAAVATKPDTEAREIESQILNFQNNLIGSLNTIEREVEAMRATLEIGLSLGGSDWIQTMFSTRVIESVDGGAIIHRINQVIEQLDAFCVRAEATDIQPVEPMQRPTYDAQTV